VWEVVGLSGKPNSGDASPGTGAGGLPKTHSLLSSTEVPLISSTDSTSHFVTRVGMVGATHQRRRECIVSRDGAGADSKWGRRSSASVSG
jgi:hypothetical protein